MNTNEIEQEIAEYKQKIKNLKKILKNPDNLFTCPQCNITKMRTNWERGPICNRCAEANKKKKNQETVEAELLGAIVKELNVVWGISDIDELVLVKDGRTFTLRVNGSDHMEIEGPSFVDDNSRSGKE